MDPSTLDYYDRNAQALSAKYVDAEAASLHGFLNRWLPDSGSVLEIGCGSGRDAAWMHRRGLCVTATDASDGMLTEARKTLRGTAVDLEKAVFPLVGTSPLLERRFDAIVCIAMFMHLKDGELFDTAFQIRQMLTPGGHIICSFCCNRENPPDDARLYVNREPEDIQLLFERIGFVFRARMDTDDSLGRPIIWTSLVFENAIESGGRPVDQIETVINRDKKTATYKLALLRALCDLAQSGYRNALWHPGGFVSIPLDLVAEKWLYYYWPLYDTPGGSSIQQIRGKRKLAFNDELTALIRRFSKQNQLSGFHCAYESNRLDVSSDNLRKQAILKIGETIVIGPVKHATQGGFRFDAETRRIHFNAGLWREMCILGHWISDAILFQWAELCVELSGRKLDVAEVLGRLVVRPETERDVAAARELYQDKLDLSCVWTHMPLQGKRFDVDHVIPFSLWHNNDLWNLLPADAKVNNDKRDKLVSRHTLLSSRDAIIGNWQAARATMPERFDFEICRTLLGRGHPEPQWEAPAFSALAEAVETLASQRNIQRWEPRIDAQKTVGISTLAVSGVVVSPSSAPSEPEYVRDHSEIGLRAFKTALPVVGRMAAGTFFDGFETGRLTCLDDVDWVVVPAKLCAKNRYVVRVDGDSMEPLFHIGDLLVFEYHRTPRQNGQIVVAANFSSGEGEYAVKRFEEDSENWRFVSENLAYSPAVIPKTDMPQYPILGTFVGRIMF